MNENVVDAVDVAWFAGLYEGEGTVIRFTGKRGPSLSMSIRMTDAEPLARCQRIMGGSFSGPYRDAGVPAHYKDKFRWGICSWRDLIRVAGLIRPHLSPRRTVQLDKVLIHQPEHPRGTLACPEKPFPSDAPFSRHRSLGIPPCEICRESRRLYVKELNLRRKGPQTPRPNHAGRHMGPRKSTTLACPTEPIPSTIGYNRHKALGLMPICEMCRKSENLYQRIRKAARAEAQGMSPG